MVACRAGACTSESFNYDLKDRLGGFFSTDIFWGGFHLRSEPDAIRGYGCLVDRLSTRRYSANDANGCVG